MTVRLDRALRDALPGISRADADRLIRAGRVAVNGAAERSAERKVDPARDALTVDGAPAVSRRFRTYMMNKPAGVLSATEDRACATVLDLLPPELRALGLSPAGRLDKDAEGLLILSNDGALVHRIISPQCEVWKRYRAELVSPAPENCDALFRAGVALDGGYVCLPARFFPGPGTREGIVCVREGKFHQVKRMLAAVGSGVARLERLSVGGLALDPALPPGGFRELSDAEIDSIFDMEKYMKLLDL